MDNPRKKLITDSIFSSVLFFFRKASTLVIMIFITKYIQAVGYGIWSQFNTTLSFFSVFLSLNLGYSIIRFLSGEKENNYVSSVFSSAFVLVGSISVLVGLFLIVFQPFVSDFLFGDQELTLLVIFFTIIMVLKNINEQNQCLLIAKRQIKTLNFILFGYFSLMMIFVSSLAVMTKDIVWVIGSLVIVEVVLFSTLIIFIQKIGIKLVKPNLHQLIPLLKFGTPLSFSLLGFWLVQLSDMYQIKYFTNISEVGIYSAFIGIASLLLIFWMAVNDIFLADFSVLYDKGDAKELEVRFSRALKYDIALSGAAMVGISVLAQPLIMILTSEEFLASFRILILMLIVLFFYGIFMKFTLLLDIMKKVMVRNLTWFFMILGNLVLNTLLIPKFGTIGAVFSTLMIFIAGAIFVLLYSKKYFNIFFKKAWVFKIIVSCIVMGLVIRFFPVSSKLSLVLTVLAGALIYGISMFLLKFSDKEELLLLKSVFKHEMAFFNK